MSVLFGTLCFDSSKRTLRSLVGRILHSVRNGYKYPISFSHLSRFGSNSTSRYCSMSISNTSDKLILVRLCRKLNKCWAKNPYCSMRLRVSPIWHFYVPDQQHRSHWALDPLLPSVSTVSILSQKAHVGILPVAHEWRALFSHTIGTRLAWEFLKLLKAPEGNLLHTKLM